MRPLHPLASSALSLPPDSYVYSLRASRSAPRLVAISSDGSVRAFAAEGLAGAWAARHEGVTCLARAGGEMGSGWLTAGTGKEVVGWDERTGGRGWGVDVGSKVAISSLACCERGWNFAVGMEQEHSVAAVAVWDSRSLNAPLVSYGCHQDDVTELSFSVPSPTTLLSGSTDGLVNMYNTTVSDEDDALLQVVNHGASIHHAGFLPSSLGSSTPSGSTPPSDAWIYALSHDETFSLFARGDAGSDEDPMDDADDPGGAEGATVLGDVRPKLECEYVVDVLPTSTAVAIAAGSHSQQRLDLVPLRFTSEWDFCPAEAVRLVGAHGGEVVRTVHIDEQSGTIFTGGEDGLVKTWKDSAEVRAEGSSGDPLKKKRKGDRRFKPY